MNKFMQEYGRLVFAIIIISGFFIILGSLLSKSDNNSIYKTQDEHTQNSSAIYTDSGEGNDISTSDTFDAVIGDVIKSSTVPYFKVDTKDNRYSITSDAFTYNDMFTNVRIIYKDKDITDLSNVNGEKVTVTVLAYKYEPELQKIEGGINYQVVMEEVDAKDKYGHYIYDTNGERVKTKQPKYKITKSIIAKNNYIDTSEKTCKYQIVYRVQVGSYKAECKVFYIKNKKETNKDVSGLVKAQFS